MSGMRSVLFLLTVLALASGCHHRLRHQTEEMQFHRLPTVGDREISRELVELEKSNREDSVLVTSTAAVEKAADSISEDGLTVNFTNKISLLAGFSRQLNTFVAKEMTAEKPPLKAIAAPLVTADHPVTPSPTEHLVRLRALDSSHLQLSGANETPLIFDIPVTYNSKVRLWIRYFQTEGRQTFKNWLQRSARYLPLVQSQLASAGLPQDLAYVAMIESGFVPSAASHAGAMGMWQFIVPTARRYGLRMDWWIDERRDFHKATGAAIRYMSDLYRQFNSWYLVAASYNMGEHGVRRLIDRYKTNNFWDLASRGVLPSETTDYVPKIIASMLIAKAPGLYGFRDLEFQMPLGYETIIVPGGTDIINLATFLGVSERYIKDLNPELTKGFVPTTERSHPIRIPRGSRLAVNQFVRMQVRDVNRTAAN